MPTSLEKLKGAILKQEPTKEQEAAIFAPQKEFLLRASPGSGKTWTSCRRFLWRVENWDSPIGGLALLSFTNSAISEFHRAKNVVGREAGLGGSHFVGTFDSFVERFIITPFGHLICGTQKRPRLHIIPRPGDRRNSKLKVSAKKKGGAPLPHFAWDISPIVSEGKLAFVGPRVRGSLHLDVKDAWEAICAFLRLGFYTHEQRNFLACHLLRKLPRLPEIIARRFPEIIVDEAQDSGFWLLSILQHLRKAGSQVTLIGDPDQCIYEFSTASAGSLLQCKADWGLIEKGLNKSFRCNNPIARAVRSIGGNDNFVGRGEPRNEAEKAYVIGDSTVGYQRGLAVFREKARNAGIVDANCAILCRGHDQIARIRGTVGYLGLRGKTRRMAEAAFLRDKKGDFKAAFELTESVLRELADGSEVWVSVDEQPESAVAIKARFAIWHFVRSPEGLPSISLSGRVWIERLRGAVGDLLNAIGIRNPPSLSAQFQRRGLVDNQMELPLFVEHALFPSIRYDTIHKTKGESIDGVLVVGPGRFFDSIAKDVTQSKPSENRRLGYVAMTRARHLLVVAVPNEHLRKYGTFWQDRGFELVG